MVNYLKQRAFLLEAPVLYVVEEFSRIIGWALKVMFTSIPDLY